MEWMELGESSARKDERKSGPTQAREGARRKVQWLGAIEELKEKMEEVVAEERSKSDALKEELLAGERELEEPVFGEEEL
jgi:hypothetical protein